VRAEPSPTTPVSAESFAVRYFVTDEDGERAREMGAADRDRFLNRARCECGQQIQAQIRLEASSGESYDNTRLIETFFGPMCGEAEVHPVGEYRRCVKLAAQVVQSYWHGVVANVHPVWLTGGVALESGEQRDPEHAIAAGSCTGSGVAGLWMCAQTNSTVGCQSDEFFMSSDFDQAAGEPPPLLYDFDPPVVLPQEVEVEAYAGGAIISWELPTQIDIAGFRVLCEEQATGDALTEGLIPQDISVPPDGQHYFTAGNLCGEQPFSTVNHGEQPAPSAACGDGVVQADEACDDGEDNRADGLCTEACTLTVGAALHDLDWGHVCTAHVEWDAGMAVVSGLENGKAYNLVLVAYDDRGNPRAVPRVLTVTPDAELPELPSAEVEGCGCRTDSAPGGLLLFTALALVRRRR